MSKEVPVVYSFSGLTTVIDPSAYVHPSAVLIGDVIIGPQAYIGGCAVLRGDFGRIVVGPEANVQDNCTVHSLNDFDCVMEKRAHIGHGAVIHGAHIGRDVLVGMNAVVLDRAEVGERTIIAAMSFVKAGWKVPADVLVTGVPGRIARPLTDADREWKRWGTDAYVALAARSLGELHACVPLTRAEADRPRLKWDLD